MAITDGVILLTPQQYDRDGEPWLAAEDALLGTNTDRVIGEMLRRSSVAVSNRRNKLGIKRRQTTIVAAEPPAVIEQPFVHVLDTMPIESRVEAAHLQFWNTVAALRSSINTTLFIGMNLSPVARARGQAAAAALRVGLQSTSAS